jgi:hypothetical protein
LEFGWTWNLAITPVAPVKDQNMATQTAEEILKSDPFYSPDTNLDLSAFPWLNPLADTSVDDEKFAPLDTRGMASGSPLRKYLNNLDREAVEELRDPELLRRFDEERGSGTTVFASNIPFQIVQRNGQWRAKGTTPDGTLHRFTANTRDALFPKITNAVRENSVRELTREEELEVVRACQAGDKLTGLGLYLRHSIGEARMSKYDGPLEALSYPTLLPVMDAAANFCWFHSHAHAVDTEEWHQYRDRILAGRPVTFELLDAIWLRYQDHLERENRSMLLGQLREPDEPEVAAPYEIESALESASDTDIEKMMTATKREYIKQVRAGVR